MERDGSVADDTTGLDVAAASFDLFDAYEGALRSFFTTVLKSETVRWFSVPAAGLDHPVFAIVLERGVRLTNAHVTDIPISEYVLRAVLDHYQQAGLWRDAQARGAWDRHQFREVAGSRWLVVGLGAIGQAIATRARAFGAHVSGCRRHPTGDEPIDAYISPADLLAALPAADIVVLSLPGENDAPPLVDAAFLAAMAEGSMLVNIARGSLVDETALVEALDRGRPEVAVLDVMATEPLPSESLLWSHPHVVLTPHNSAGGWNRYDRYDALLVDNLGRYARGEPLRNEVFLG
jgi:phosphoglycerate dehydrogenase-like enzyme